LFDKATKVLSIVTGFSVVFGALSGFSLATGLAQQEHRLLEQKITAAEHKNTVSEERIKRLEGTIFGI
jgi:hypothetical protein